MAMEQPLDMGDEPDEEERRQNPAARFISMLQDGLIGVLYMMGKDMVGSYFIAVLTMFVDCAQLAALATPMLFNTPDHPAQENKYLIPLHNFFDVFHLGNSSNMNNVLVPVALILVFLLLFNVLHVAYCWVYQIFGWFFVVRILRAAVIILGGVLYMPVLTALGATVHCNGLDSMCGVYRPLALLAALFFIPFILITAATFFDPRRDGEGPYTMPHARVAVFHQLVRTVLAVLAAILPEFYKGDDLQGILMFWSILLAGLSGALVYSYVWLQPYYRPRFNTLRGALATIVFWFSVCFVISGVWKFDPEQNSPAVLFYGGLCLMIPFMHVLLLWRSKALRVNFFPNNASLLFGDMEAELKIRFVLEDAVVEMQREARERGGGKKKMASSIEAAHTKAATWYTKATNMYPKSALLCAMQAQFFIYEMDKPLLARKALLEAESRGARLDIAFSIYKTKKYTEENASQNSDIMTWVACEKYWKLSKFYDRRCCLLLCEFWAGLGDTKLKVSAIQRLADEIAGAVKDASAAYTKLVRLKPDDLDILNTYAGFLECICNDPEQAQKIKVRATTLRTRAGKETGNDGKFNDSDCSILRVDASGTSQTGIILSANEVSGRIFNQPSSSLVGKVVSSLLLPPFTLQFEDIMEEYLQHGNEEYFNETFKTYVYLDGHYVVMPCSLELKPFSTDGINFQVFVRVKQRSSSQVVLVDPETKRVIGVTSQARNNLQRHFATSDLQSIEDVIPGYSQRRGEFLKPEGSTLNLKFGESVSLQIKNVQLHGPKAPMVDELTFLFSTGGEGPVPLEVYHTDTEHNQNSHVEEDTDQLLENDSFALDPIREQSEGSEASRSRNQDAAADISGASDDEPTADQTTAEPTTAEGLSTNDGDSMLEGLNNNNGPSGDENIPANARLVVALDDDNENENMPLTKAERHTSGSISETSETKKSISGSFSQNDRGGSEHAGSVVSSVASSGIGASRRIFLNSDNKLDPSLNRFRQLYKIFVFLTMLVIVAVYLVRDAQMMDQMETLDFTPKSGMRRYRAVRIAYMANSLYLLSRNFELPSGHTEYFCRNDLYKSAEELQGLDRMLFNMKSKFSGQLYQYYDSEVVWLHRVIQEPNVTFRKYSMFDASQAFASGARFLSEKPLDLLSNDDVDVHFLVDNIVPYSQDDEHYPGFLQALNYTTKAFAELSKKTQKSMDTISVVLAATVLLGFLILLVVMLIPLATGIDRSKVEVFRHLLGMPRSVFPTIAGRFSARLLDVHDETAEGQIDVQHTNNTDAEGKRKKIAANANAAKGKGKQQQHTDERSIASVEAALRANSNKYYIIGKIGVSLIVLIIYFTCTLYWNFQTEDLLSDASFVADYANLRMVTLMHAILKIRLLETGGKQFGGFDVTYEQVKNSLSELDAIQQGLLNGDDHRQLKGIIHATHDKTRHKELLFENGCIGMETPEYTGIPCSEYKHGVVGDGLLSGYRTWIRLAMQYLHATHLDTDEDYGHHILTEEEVHERLEMQDFRDLSDLEEFYLSPSLKKSTYFYVMYEHWVFDRIHYLSMNSCIIVVVALALCYFFTTRLLYSLDKEIKRTRSLVFMIPDDILQTHPKIKAFLSELARRQAKATR